MFIMVCTEAVGKMVIWPGVRVSSTVRAPFSAIMKVRVVPDMATTKLVARGWMCGGSMEQGPRLSIAWDYVSFSFSVMRIKSYQCHTLANHGRERGGIGVDNTTWSKGVFVLLGEVEVPILVLGKESHSVEVGGGHSELSA